MSQDKTQKTFKHQVISQDAQFPGAYRKLESATPASSISFAKQFVSSDSREENFSSFKVSNGSKMYSIPGTGMTTDEKGGKLKRVAKNVEVKEKEMGTDNKEAEMETEMESEMGKAAIWDGPLSRYNTWMSNKSPKECMKAIEKAVKKMEEGTSVDWEMEEYNAFGRMYHELDVSEFIINVYISSDNEFKSVIEIRRSSGDTFVHDEFFRQIAQCLEEEAILESRCDEPTIDFSLSLTLEPLSLDSLAQLDTLDTDLLKELTCSDGTSSSDGTSISDVTEIPCAEQLGDELIDIVTDRNSFQDVFRHSSGVLYQEIKQNTLLLQYVASQTDIIQRLIKPLTQDFYDTLIIRNILQVVKQLLQNQSPKVSVHANCLKEIENLKTTWANSVQHKFIDMKFCRSQQVERLCCECLELLQKRI